MSKPATATAKQTDARTEIEHLLSGMSNDALHKLLPVVREYAGIEEPQVTTQQNATTRNEAGEELVSFDPDGTGYTAKQLGDMLDERYARVKRGESGMTLEEFGRRIDQFWETSE